VTHVKRAAQTPPPSAGEGGLRSRPGEGNPVSGEVARVMQGARWTSVALPLSRLTSFATLPRRGGRVEGAPVEGAAR
jgi:hypothetical protein